MKSQAKFLQKKTRIVKKKLDGETKVLDGAVFPYYYGWSF